MFMRYQSAGAEYRGQARWDERGSFLLEWLLCGTWWSMLLYCICLDDRFAIVFARRGRFDC